MKCINLPFILALLAGTTLQSAIENGIYHHSEHHPKHTAVDAHGHMQGFGEIAELDIRRATVMSSGNENTRYNVAVHIPYDETITTSAYWLVVDGTAYRQEGGGSSGAGEDKTSHLSFTLNGPEKAEKVAALLNTTCLHRRHPGHQLAAQFNPLKESYEPGEEVVVELRLKNLGADPVTFLKGGRNRAPRDNQYHFNAYRYTDTPEQVPDKGTPVHHGGLGHYVTIEPGETFTDKVNLSKWFDFDTAGNYQVLGTYGMYLLSPEESFNILWEDYLTSEFSLRVGEAEE